MGLQITNLEKIPFMVDLEDLGIKVLLPQSFAQRKGVHLVFFLPVEGSAFFRTKIMQSSFAFPGLFVVEPLQLLVFAFSVVTQLSQRTFRMCWKFDWIPVFLLTLNGTQLPHPSTQLEHFRRKSPHLGDPVQTPLESPLLFPEFLHLQRRLSFPFFLPLRFFEREFLQLLLHLRRKSHQSGGGLAVCESVHSPQLFVQLILVLDYFLLVFYLLFEHSEHFVLSEICLRVPLAFLLGLSSPVEVLVQEVIFESGLLLNQLLRLSFDHQVFALDLSVHLLD